MLNVSRKHILVFMIVLCYKTIGKLKEHEKNLTDSIFFDLRILYQEIDYINEGKNADRFRRDFRNINWVRVPVCFLLSCF